MFYKKSTAVLQALYITIIFSSVASSQKQLAIHSQHQCFFFQTFRMHFISCVAPSDHLILRRDSFRAELHGKRYARARVELSFRIFLFNSPN